jgi:hypothetical protein
MGLWLEHRDESGNLIDRGRFLGGTVTLYEMAEEPLTVSADQAMKLAKLSSHLPVEKRDWVLRIVSDD